MNNLIIASLLLAAAGVCWLGERQTVAAIRSENAALAAEERAIQLRVDEETRLARRLETELVDRRAESNRVATESAAIRAQAEVVEKPPTNPAEEGHWPSDRPYFYLSKKHLAGVRYSPLTDRDEVSDAAATLLGMTGADRAHVNAALSRAREEIRQLELELAVPTNPPPSLNGYKGEKTSYFIPRLPDERFMKIQTNFGATLAQRLGPNRTQILARRIGETMDRGAFGFGFDRVITLIRDGETRRIAINNGQSFTINQFTAEEWRREIPREFAHLFPNAE